MTAPKTEKLYLEDPYIDSFRAHVVSFGQDPGARGVIVLDRSRFFPESGGQTCDRGTIGPARVIDVQEGDGDSILHFVEPGGETNGLSAGGVVECRVDWKRRFDHMQQHTGQHLLSRAFIEIGDLHTVSFHMGEETCTIDLEGSRYDADIAERAEDMANAVIVENRPVRVREVTLDELDDLDRPRLRREIPEGVTDVRLIDVEKFDIIPCCGTHVRATGELGMVKVLKSEKVRGAVRVHFVVGARAFGDYREKHNIVQTLGSRLTTSAADVVAKVEKLSSEGQRARKELKRSLQALAGHEARALVTRAESENDVNIVVEYVTDGDDDYLRALADALKREQATVAILGAANGSVICCASEKIPVDFQRAAVEPAKARGGRGGGKGAYAQLKLPSDADVRGFLEEIADNVKQSMG